jgi:alpha-1,3-glucan synthase
MSSSLAWQAHGCYVVGSVKYASFPIDAGLYGCQDDNVSLDHRDPSHPVRNVIKRMFDVREVYPVLNDGYYLQSLSNQTYNVYLPGSNGTPTETGLWSVYRSGFDQVQDFTGTGQEGQSVWLLYTNEDKTVDYDFDCNDNSSLVAPFDEGTVVKNLLPPYDEYDLAAGSKTLGIEGSTKRNGCIEKLSMPPWGFKAMVPKNKFVASRPVITDFTPGHDMRIVSTITTGERIPIKVEFSEKMDCDSIARGLEITSKIEEGGPATLDEDSVRCSDIKSESARWVGQPTSAFAFEADLVNVGQGIHRITFNNVSSTDAGSTDSVDHFLFRLGSLDNPMVFPRSANYSKTLLFKDGGDLKVRHQAAGADLWRYSLNFGTTYSDWKSYSGGNDTLAPRIWSGTKDQAWKGQHVTVQYWSRLAGSADHLQHGDIDSDSPPRRFPNLWLEGAFNQHGFDAGVFNQLKLHADGLWKINFMNEWPAQVSLNSWGINPDGQPDVTRVFGDIDGDGVLDRIPPQSLLKNVVNLTDSPPSPYLAYRLELNDANLRYTLVPVGSRWMQLALYMLLGIIPILTASGAAFVFVKSFYQIKFNEFGTAKAPFLPMAIRRKFRRFHDNFSFERLPAVGERTGKGPRASIFSRPFSRPTKAASRVSWPLTSQETPPLESGLELLALQADAGASNRRSVLIATMEYDIEDWKIKIKIGGLGVMAQLMGKNLGHQDLIWVVPCVGDVDYPEDPDEVAEPMIIVVLGESYKIQVRTHILRNITYVLLDAPVFRQQTKAEPYPPRMDDLDSAIYYSAWNSCIAEAIRRYEPDVYHLNDYHGAVAPLHLLPKTIPMCLSLHNAEFQGLWPMRTKDEREEVCRIYNLDPDVVQEYVQFGEVFNLLHAGASYLRIHQNGFGAVGVSKKYGKRAYSRYPIFWGLKDIGALPNPDPSDTAEWNPSEANQLHSDIQVDAKFEAARGDLRVQAQKWAGLNVDPNAELFCYIGRWSMQKGVDLIADVFPSILEQNPSSQLICIGPVIDLFGTFAAIKLARLMEVYPGRVFSKPVFTQIPPYIYSGAEFALIPSRDEPFGLVAVEFGRKGALGVGARVGGLGQMPGWWYTVESTSTIHLLQQFKGAIECALESTRDVRAVLRARCGKQRFPVSQWVEDLETLQGTAIKKHGKYANRSQKSMIWLAVGGESGASTPVNRRSRATSRTGASVTRESSPNPPALPPNTGQMLQRMGSRQGPGHLAQNQMSRRSSAEYLRDPDNGMASDFEYDEGIRGRSRASSTVRSRVTSYASRPPDISDAQSLAPSLEQAESFLSVYGLSSPRMNLNDRMSLHPNDQDEYMLPRPGPVMQHNSARNSTLSIPSVVGEKTDFELQKTTPFFTDPRQEYARAFEKKLADLNGKNSYSTCIEDFIEKSEKDWFNRLRGVKMGKSSTPVSSIFRYKGDSPPGSIFNDSNLEEESDGKDQFLLDHDYKPPTGVKKMLLHRLGDWPLYSLLLAFVS